VRIVLELADLQDIEVGDVLVTPMTRPEYGVALDRAGAFVTDEGGRNCHAAIIAREMGKPCVIATHTGTSTLRDGMLVRVDGAAGTVAVLEANAA
jgi:pyruvate,water dikinase